MENRKTFNLALNEITSADDPTKVECNFYIIDFEKSHNNAVISKEVAMDGMAQSIINKPIVAHYNSTTSDDPNGDSFESHNVYIDEDKHGDLAIKFDTTPIGVFTSEGYVTEIETTDGKIEVLAADAILWKDRFAEAVELLQEWNTRGININTSCEILYSNYEVKDGVEHIKSPIYFSGHAVLNSEERGDQPVVLPAYDSSRLASFNEVKEFNRLVASAIQHKENDKEGETMPTKFKKVFELSHSDVRSQIYKVLDPQLNENEYSWLVDVYDNHFVVEIVTDDAENFSVDFYKFSYAKENDQVSIDMDSKQKVMEKREWVELEEVQNMQAQLSAKEKELKTLQSEKETVQDEKEQAVKQFNEASDKLVSLNEKLEGLQEIEKQYNKEQFEKQLKEKKELFSAKFEALGAKEKFDSEEVQELIEKAVSEDSAVFQLNAMIVELIQAKEDEPEEAQTQYVQHSSKRENLVPEDEDFDSRYSI
ncbi:coiled-coil domain-containing protein [Halobacillus litoralis]|uniref:coiled-coil domain-containing protein n=1 Tax=Halobacillus litoralis TaxID=45668 RepID=UPI001CD25D87|nr:hypothetical protein [Halobacillus litoralis]MCA1021638.1 hypothetical protein [Halobacillus litoralis]